MIFIDHNNPFYKIKILDYTYTCQPSINTALPLRKSILKAIFFVLGCIISVGFLWLITKWSSKNKAILLYSVCSLTTATQFLIEQQDLKGGTCIVKRQQRYNIKKKTVVIAFTYHERTYLYDEQKQSFYPIRFQQLGIYLDKLRKNIFIPYSEEQRKQLQNYYGENAIRLPIQSKFEIFLQQMLTPYEVFQTYGIIVWIYEQYYFFAFLLLIYSLVTYWLSSREITENQRKLAEQSYFQTQCKVLQKNNHNEGQKQFKKSKNNSQFYCKRVVAAVSKKTHDFEVFCDEISTPCVQINPNIGSHKNLMNHLGIDTKKISSHQIVPGDLLILQQGDIVPCDCILIKGQILANEQYTTGQSYPVRKTQLSDFIYAIEKEKSFMLTLGTRILKIKNNDKGIKRRLADSYAEHSLEKSMACDKYTQQNQIICLVTDTNYNTLRGKYLRAIRYQKKQQQTFTIETIYFIYILLALTTIMFGVIYSRIYHHMHIWAAIVIYLDLFFTCVPPTLPTALSVGISFAQMRLSSYGINCVVPDCILTGGRVNTIVLQGYRALGKKYQIDSVIVGTKQDRALGRVYTSFKQYTEQDVNGTLNDLNKTEKYLNTKKQLGKTAQMFFSALASCHTLQMFQGQLQGQQQQKELFNFSQSYFLHEDRFENNKNQISVGKRIYFRSKDSKMAVAATIQKDQRGNGYYPDKSHGQRSLMDEMYQNPSLQIQKLDGPNGPKKVIFMKGPPQKILNICKTQTYPKNSFQYIVDMAEKGFLVLAYAYREFPYTQILGTEKQISQTYRTDYIFLGYAVLKQKRSKENEDAIQILKKANLNVLLVSEERQLQTNSIAILNNIYTKNQLLLCSMNKEKTIAHCRGHIEWDSSGSDPAQQLRKQLLSMKKKSYYSITAPLYEQLFMRREENQQYQKLFNRFKVYSQMLQKHQRNLYYQLEKRNKITFAVGGGGNLSQCANVSLQLQRKQSSLLSSFYSQDQSLLSVVNCLRICRAGLSTNFHCFNMMILFSIVQFTTVSILQYHFQVLTDGQSLYLDLFVTFPIFITLNMTLPSKKLSKQIPQGSFFTLRALATTIGQSIIQLIAQGLFIYYLLQFPLFEMQKSKSEHYFKANKEFMDTTLTSTSIFILSNYLYLGIVLSTSVSKPFRKPFYTNPFYTVNLILLWIYNTIIVAYPPLVSKSLRLQNTTSQQEFILALALIFGNLVMLLMYMYENFLVWIWQIIQKRSNKKDEKDPVKSH